MPQKKRLLIDAKRFQEKSLDPMKIMLRANAIVKKMKIEKDVFTVASMNEEDLHHVMNTWSLGEGWYPTQYTVEPFLAADPQGYYLLFRNGNPVASLSAVRYPDIKVAFLGLYIVPPAYRGQGFGKILWDAVTTPLLIENGFVE